MNDDIKRLEVLTEKNERLAKKIESCSLKIGNTRNLIRVLWGSIITNVALVITGVFLLGGMESDIRHNEALLSETVKQSDYTYIEKDVYDLKNKVWYNRDTRFETRGSDAIPNL